MAPVVATWRRIVVVPLAIIDGNSHLGRIAIVQAVGAAIVVAAPVILWVRDVRVMVELVHVDSRILAAPTGTVGTLLSVGVVSLVDDGKRHADTGDGQ